MVLIKFNNETEALSAHQSDIIIRKNERNKRMCEIGFILRIASNTRKLFRIEDLECNTELITYLSNRNIDHDFATFD